MRRAQIEVNNAKTTRIYTAKDIRLSALSTKSNSIGESFRGLKNCQRTIWDFCIWLAHLSGSDEMSTEPK